MKATDRARNYHAGTALEACLVAQKWQAQGILDAIVEADQDGKQVEHERIREWVESWNTDAEEKSPP